MELLKVREIEFTHLPTKSVYVDKPEYLCNAPLVACLGPDGKPELYRPDEIE